MDIVRRDTFFCNDKRHNCNSLKWTCMYFIWGISIKNTFSFQQMDFITLFDFNILLNFHHVLKRLHTQTPCYSFCNRKRFDPGYRCFKENGLPRKTTLQFLVIIASLIDMIIQNSSNSSNDNDNKNNRPLVSYINLFLFTKISIN